MASITLKGNPVKTIGELPKKGEQAKDFTLVKNDLSRITLSEYKGKQLVLNIFPSIGTGVCQASVRRFNKMASEIDETLVLCISRDLPFALQQFCGAEGLDNVITLSDFENGSFGKDYGLLITNGIFQGLLSRVVIIIDKNGKITYTQQVPDISHEPDYDDVMQNL
jgi:thiol peroxidase